MAVFDKKIHKNVCLDDTEVLSITIENAQNVSGHTVSISVVINNNTESIVKK